jgi:hypothetical protein
MDPIHEHPPLSDAQNPNDDFNKNQNVHYPSVQYPPTEYNQFSDFNQPISENQIPHANYPEHHYE